MLDKRIATIVSMCAQFYMNNSNMSQSEYHGNTLYNMLRTTLTNAFKGISLLQQSVFPGWSADDNHPGYLIKVDPPYVIRAPLHIVPVFPTGEFLDDVWHVSRLIKTDQHSVVCISGSSTSVKVTRAVNDIDFCEYIKITHKDVTESILRKVVNSEQLIFRKLKFNGRHWSPENVSDSRDHLNHIDANQVTVAHGKIDYIAQAPGNRPVRMGA